MTELEQKLRHVFADSSLLETALTHSSYANENRGRGECNERLEFLGDSVLGLTVADELYRSFPELPEGRMTRLRAQLVCEESLHRVALELGLGEYIRLGRGESRTGGRQRASILADAVEAVIAALYLDGGMEVARKFIAGHILSELGDGAVRPQVAVQDYKTDLQELVQRRSGQLLAYEPLSESGPDHDKTFTARVTLNGEPVGEGSGRTKKEAEQSAAQAALGKLANEC